MHRSIASKQILPAVYNKRCLHDLLPHLFFICISIIVIVARVLLDTVPVGIFDTLVQKRLRRERRARRRLQEQLELEVKRRVQLEDALKTAGGDEQIRIINENLSINEQRQNTQKNNSGSSPSAQSLPVERVDRTERSEREKVDSPPRSYSQSVREQPPPDIKPWGYSGIDLINTGAAFWQNYSESLAQELEMERKSRQQQVETDVKPPLQDRQNYYKNSVLFTSSAT
ncbi:hypothetical protein QE152_g13329 [Popillia japonica]|uniref:Uncharacterized protein n=1 Tax=Popillia japonica TaxID=7064 RepID=A0AAW1LCB4_POPJA